MKKLQRLEDFWSSQIIRRPKLTPISKRPNPLTCGIKSCENSF